MEKNNVVIKSDEETTITKVPSNGPVAITDNAGASSAVAEKKSSKKVEVDSDILTKVMDELAALRKQVGEVESTSSQDQIRKIEALRATGKLVKSVKLRSYLLDGEPLLVLGWKTVRDDVWVADGKLHENQIIGLYLENAKEKETPLAEFTRNSKYVAYEVIKEGKLNNGETEFTVLLGDGKELTINSKFVN